MKRILFASLLLTLLAFSGFGQTFSATKAPSARVAPLHWAPPTVRQAQPAIRAGQPVTLSWAQVQVGVRRIDSLTQLAANRRKQTLVAARLANSCFRAADSLRTALDYRERELVGVKSALVNTNVLLVSQAKKTDKYRARAHRKGWVIAGLSALLAGLAYGQVAR